MSAPQYDGGLVIRPGDTLVITFARNPTSQEMDDLQIQLRQHIPSSIPIAIIGGASGLAVIRPE